MHTLLNSAGGNYPEMNQAIDQIKKRERPKLAVSLAMERKWEEAAAINKEILLDEANNLEALNRLGKALSEIGKYSEAKNAFQKVLTLSPSNGIAKKNLERIVILRAAGPQVPIRQAVSPGFFIEETGKSGMTILVDLAPNAVIARLGAGEPLTLVPQEHKLLVKNLQGEYVGTVDPKLGLRLLRLIRGGNRYEAAIAGMQDQKVRIIIKQSYQHPSQHGRLSFPPRVGTELRGNIWEGGQFTHGDEEDSRDADDASNEHLGLEDIPGYKRIRSKARKHEESDEEEEN